MISDGILTALFTFNLVLLIKNANIVFLSLLQLVFKLWLLNWLISNDYGVEMLK
jgi:hypothetical protein